MGVKQNVSELKSTILGTLLTLFGGLMYYYMASEKFAYADWSFWAAMGMIISGVFLILSPNKVLGIFGKITSKFLK